MTTALKEQKTMKYKNFTITPSTSGRKTFDYWDGEYDGERVRRADTIQEAKDVIDEIRMNEEPYPVVVMNKRKYPFKWLSDAFGFAKMWGGEVTEVRFENM